VTAKIDQAKAAAIAALAAAYTPHAVEQPGGAPPLHLCWAGRIARAYDRLAAAREDAKRRGDKDDATVKAIQKSIDALTAKYAEAQRTAEDAASTWAALATAAGQSIDPASIYPPACTCDGCKTAALWHDHNEARGKYSDALYALLAPEPSARPPLFQMLEDFTKSEQDRDRFWAAMKGLYASAKGYDAACKAAGVQPNWRMAMAPWVEE
jgi:hypothetical protein